MHSTILGVKIDRQHPTLLDDAEAASLARPDSTKQDLSRATLGSVRPRGASTEELERVYRSRFDSFLRVATAITRDGDLGRDAVQAAFVSAVRGRRSFRGSGGGLDAWLWTIVLREARRLARAERHLSLDQVAEEAEGPTDGNGSSDGEGIGRYISALPQRQREAIFLRYFADLDYRTIARVLEVEPGTVSATLSAAHQTLRKRLEARTR